MRADSLHARRLEPLLGIDAQNLVGLRRDDSVRGCRLQRVQSADPLSPTVAGPIPGVSITAPTLMLPSNGSNIAVAQQPITLTVGNATTTGVRPLTYAVEIAVDAAFASKVFTRNGIAPGSGQTSLPLPSALATGATYYWHAQAQDGANTGPFFGGSELHRLHADRPSAHRYRSDPSTTPR